MKGQKLATSNRAAHHFRKLYLYFLNLARLVVCINPRTVNHAEPFIQADSIGHNIRSEICAVETVEAIGQSVIIGIQG